MFRLLLPAMCFLCPPVLFAAEPQDYRAPIAGPIEAELISVVDGDTLLVQARPWPQHSVTVLVRIRGIDAPELKSKCGTARLAANRAKMRLAGLAHGRIRLTNIAGDKYFGRVVATVSTGETRDIGATLLAQGLVRAYDGGRRSAPNC